MEFQQMYKPRPRVQVEFSERGEVKQSFKDECDINLIVKRYVKTGQLPVGVRVGTYGDFSGPSDLLEARMVIEKASAQFDALPATVRERFRNDPGRFLEFIQDKRNIEEARELGLLLEVPDPEAEVKRLQKIAADAAAAVLSAAGQAPVAK